MTKKSKRIREIAKIVEKEKVFPIKEALISLKKCPGVKFDQSVEISLKTGIDVKKSDQQIRGTVGLPHGLGKQVRVVVFAKDDKIKEALDAGADFAGHEELIEKVKGGWTDFDAVVATPAMMRDVGKLGQILGPRGLMPTPKAGTVTQDVGKAVRDLKAGKVEFKVDKSGVINNMVGKLSFETEKLEENIKVLLQAIAKTRPSSTKGQFLKSLVVSSTMGPGLKVELNSVIEAI